MDDDDVVVGVIGCGIACCRLGDGDDELLTLEKLVHGDEEEAYIRAADPTDDDDDDGVLLFVTAACFW